MKCPTCIAEGKRSQVELVTMVPFTQTIASPSNVRKFWDEDGRKHVHDPTEREELYQCSNSHRWSHKFKNPCPERTCDFNKEKASE